MNTHTIVKSILNEMATESRDWVEHVVNWLIIRLKNPNYSQKAYAEERGFTQGDFNKAVGKYGQQALDRLKKLGHNPDLYSGFLTRQVGRGRPSKLSELEWQELVKDYLERRVSGQSITPAQVAKEYGVLPATFEIKVIQYEKHFPELSGRIADAERRAKDAEELAKKPKGLYINSSPYILPEMPSGDTKTSLRNITPGSAFTYVRPNREQALSSVLMPKEPPSPGPTPRPAVVEIAPWKTLDGWNYKTQPKVLVVGGYDRSIPEWVKLYFEYKLIDADERPLRGDPLGNYYPDLIVMTRWVGHNQAYPIMKAARQYGIPIVKAMPGWASAVTEVKNKSDYQKYRWFADAAAKGGMSESLIDSAIHLLSNGVSSEVVLSSVFEKG